MTAAPPRPPEPPDMALAAPAKINLFLEVLGRRADGYHEIETVVQAVDLADRLEFWRRPAGELTITVSGGPAPAGEANLALHAARLLAAEGGAREGAHLHIEKRIPTGGGLGGGSSDAAAALRGLDRLWGLAARREDLQSLGARLGSDVNFFLTGGLALCRGRGELVEPMTVNNTMKYLLHFPQLQVSTGDIYARLRIPLTNEQRACTNISEALRREDWPAVGRELFNRLEEPAFTAHPRLAAVKEGFRDEEVLGALLSGSGSTIYALTTPGAAEGLRSRLAEKLRGGELRAVQPLAGWR